MTLAEHKKAGKALKKIRDSIQQVAVAQERERGKTHRLTKQCRNAVQQLDDLRSDFDNLVGRDCPGLSDDALNHIYYPGQ